MIHDWRKEKREKREGDLIEKESNQRTHQKEGRERNGGRERKEYIIPTLIYSFPLSHLCRHKLETHAGKIMSVLCRLCQVQSLSRRVPVHCITFDFLYFHKKCSIKEDKRGGRNGLTVEFLLTERSIESGSILCECCFHL